MDTNKKNRIYRTIMIIIVTALITCVLTTTGMYYYLIKTDSGNIKALIKYIEVSDDATTLTQKIGVIDKLLEETYISDLDKKAMIESAIKGYVDGLGDKYTTYLTADEYGDLLTSVTGNYVGIGVYIAKTVDNEVLIISTLEDSPAEEKGLQAGDIILSIDGENCEDMDINLVSTKIKGDAGTFVKLEIKREEEKLTIDIERRVVELKYIEGEEIEPGIGYIKMISFDKGCTDKFENYLKEFDKKGINNLIIDLRDNGGGVVQEALAMSELFVENGNVIMCSYAKDNIETVVKSERINPYDMNIVVLVNENSASATEIFAAALKDNDTAQIVGIKTLGKGVMQEVRPLGTMGALKVTIEEFKTPNGDKINGVGVEPNVVVEDSETEDLQLQKAIEILKQ